MLNIISTYDAAKWMARLAATDGAISSAERKVLSEFADAFGIDRTKLIRLSYGMTNEVDVPEVEIVNQNEKKVGFLKNLSCRCWLTNLSSNYLLGAATT